MNKDAPPGQSLAVTLDLKAYLAQLDDWDIPDDQKTEFIRTLWELLLSFAQMGFDIHPAQAARKVGRKTRQKPTENTQVSIENAALSAADLLYSKPIYRTHIISETGVDEATNRSDLKGEEISA